MRSTIERSASGLRRAIAVMVVALVAAILLSQTTTPVQAGTGNNYPWKTATFPSCSVDNWDYCKRWCTSWVAWALHDRNGFEMPRAIGDASNWGVWARDHGYAVNMTPARGSVAWWDGKNHVAWVKSVNSNGTVTVEEYNNPAGSGTYNIRTISKGSVSGYIHFKDLPKPPPPPAKWNGIGNAKFLGGDTLTSGQRLRANEYILSGNGQHALFMQKDGNLVLYGHGRAVWSSRTAGHSGANLVVQGDGNIVIYHNGKALWNTRTGGDGVNRLAMQSDGNLVARTASNQAKWASNTVGSPNYTFRDTNELSTGMRLSSGQYIRSSDKRYVLLMQTDGNLVLYGSGYHVLWSSRTNGRPGANLVVQGDGNIVIYHNGKALWNTNTVGTDVSRLVVQNDGNLVAYTLSGKAEWTSNTAGKI